MVASKINKLKESYDKLLESKDKQFINDVTKDKNRMKKIIKSLAPEIFGMETIKKALLLQMVGGSNIKEEGGVTIRGTLHLGLVGDPGVAKS